MSTHIYPDFESMLLCEAAFLDSLAVGAGTKRGAISNTEKTNAEYDPWED